ncbi:MAG: hypothetical protein PHQ60_08005 [Sideroxydans sp.]|nr:hypothetical protein [Sideroxydans sp.]
MQITSFTSRPPQLLQALTALAQRADHQQDADMLLQELGGITVLVAKRFTNDRTAEGMLEAFHLTTGCISLGISLADISPGDESRLSFLLSEGAERVFQAGFRKIKELSALPYTPFISDFDSDPFIQQRNVKLLFGEICRADPDATWHGDEVYKNEMRDRRNNQRIIECARWLRTKHFAGPVKDSELDANAVIAIALIFAIAGDGPIVARVKQADIETLIRGMRETRPDIEAGWDALLNKVPPEFHPLLRERMDEFRDTIVRKILSNSKIKTLVAEVQDYYAGNEQEIDYD